MGIITKPNQSVAPADSFPANLPPLKPSERKPFSWAKKQKTPDAKPTLPIVEVKKAAKLLAAMGKTVAAIEVLPHGGFRVEATVQPGPSVTGPPPNPFDVVLK